jgi:hypothetical protein
MTTMRSLMPMTSRSSDEIMITAMPSLRSLADEAVDGGLAVDVDAAGGLVEDEQVLGGGEPLRQHDLLLVAAREELHLLVQARRRARRPRWSARPPGGVRSGRRARGRQQRPQARYASTTLSAIDCRSDRPSRLRSSVMKPRRRRTASRGERSRTGRPWRWTVAAGERIRAEERAGELGAAGALEAGDAEHLATADLEVDVVQHGVAAALDAQHDLAELSAVARSG